MQADGWSQNDKRRPLPLEHKLELAPDHILKQSNSKLPDVLARWTLRDASERHRAQTKQDYCVPKAVIFAGGYDLSINRYNEVFHEVVPTQCCTPRCLGHVATIPYRRGATADLSPESLCRHSLWFGNATISRPAASW